MKIFRIFLFFFLLNNGIFTLGARERGINDRLATGPAENDGSVRRMLSEVNRSASRLGVNRCDKETAQEPMGGNLSLDGDTLTRRKESTREIPLIPYRFNPKRLILPASLITIGAVGTAIDGMNDFHLFHRKDSVRKIRIDDYLEWGMLGWVFVCDLIGKEKHSWIDQLCVVAIAEGLNAGMTRTLKYTVNEKRPDGRPYSFPSGHTANAFLGAHLAYKEFKDSSPVLAYSGYVLAVFVACSRIHNNRHWVADVVAGAGFGILSVELASLIYFPFRNTMARLINLKKNDRLVVAPSVSAGGGGVYLSYTF